MESRLVFLHHAPGDEADGDPVREVPRAEWTGCVPAGGAGFARKRGRRRGRGGSGAFGQSDGMGPVLARKAIGGAGGVTVPQTDTGGLAQTRRGGRATPRQGTRQVDAVTSGEGVPLGVAVACAGGYDRWWAWLRLGGAGRGPGDCLPKTQVSANAQADV
jgi:hypothetical protein